MKNSHTHSFKTEVIFLFYEELKLIKIILSACIFLSAKINENYRKIRGKFIKLIDHELDILNVVCIITNLYKEGN